MRKLVVAFGWAWVRNFRVAAVFAAIGVAALSLRADVKLPALFSDHLVLQRGRECALWGSASPGERVTATIGGEPRSARAAADGKWALKLPQLTTAGPYTLTVKGNNTITIEDVLAGEVWLGSGQSNMELTVSQAQDFTAEKAAAHFPHIRMFREESLYADAEQSEGKGQWVICAPETVARFSAALYFFGREIHEALAAPVGLINASRGGTPIESWLPEDVQRAAEPLKPFFKAKQIDDAAFDRAAAKEKYERDLATWKIATSAAKDSASPPRKPVDPVELHDRWGNVGGLFNGKIAPLIPYTIRGAVWYQGEANAGTDKAQYYRYQLPLLIEEWRRRWGYEFPFAWVQLPNLAVTGRDWPLIREAMLKTLSVPNTGMTVNIDIGDPREIHAKNKQEIGRRLSLWAIAEVYGQRGIVWSGPLFSSMERKGSNLIVHFTHTHGGLVAKTGELGGFMIAGNDRHWRPATARIEGDTVVVTNREISTPVAIRYAWENNPIATLTNTAGLPASPFRTDDWPSQ